MAYRRDNWTWEFWPPPYASASVPPGLGCPGCNGRCRGVGLFDSLDFSTWGIMEWGAVALGAYLLLSLWGDVGRTARRVRTSSSKRKRKAERRRELKEELATL
jgi:hypothetical protein